MNTNYIHKDNKKRGDKMKNKSKTPYYPNLDAAMAKKGLTGGDMSKMLGIEENTFSLKKNGKSVPFNTEQAFIMADALNETIDHLFLHK